MQSQLKAHMSYRWPSAVGASIVVDDGTAEGIGRRVEEIVNLAKEVILLHGRESPFLLFSCRDHRLFMIKAILFVDSERNGRR